MAEKKKPSSTPPSKSKAPFGDAERIRAGELLDASEGPVGPRHGVVRRGKEVTAYDPRTGFIEPSTPPRPPLPQIGKPPPQAGAPAPEPNYKFLDKFRAGMAGSGAVTAPSAWDPAYNPEAQRPGWLKDRESSDFEQQVARNREKEAWLAGMPSDQVAQHMRGYAKNAGGEPLPQDAMQSIYQRLQKNRRP